MSLDPLYVLLGEMSVQVFCPFFNWVFCLPGVESCEFFIYFRDQTLVWGVIGKYVFPYAWFSLILVLFCLAVQNRFILMRSHLFILSFMPLALGDISVKIFVLVIFEIFLTVFLKDFTMSWLIFMSFIHLEFIFVYFVSWWSSYFSFLFFCM